MRAGADSAGAAGVATPGFLGMMEYGHPLAVGRTFIEDEGIDGRDRVVILTYRLWQDRFGGDRAIVGRQIRLDNEPYTVVGVLGEGPADRQWSKICADGVPRARAARRPGGSDCRAA